MTQQTGRKTSGVRNRVAGHTWERDCVNLVKECGYQWVVTSRSENRTRDNEKVDLMNHNEYRHGRLPYNIQCKTLSKTCVYPKLLSEMPQDGEQINVIFHKQTELSGTRFMTRGSYAILNLADFLAMMKKENIQDKETQRYKQAFEILMNYWDCIPDEEQESVNNKLKELDV